MSRGAPRAAVLMLAILPAILPSTSWAQEVPSPAPADYAAKARDYYGMPKRDCGSGKGDEIVVCGRRGPSPYRLPLPSPPVAGVISRDAVDMADAAARPMTSCNQGNMGPGCVRGLNFIPLIGQVAAKLIEKAAEGD